MRLLQVRGGKQRALNQGKTDEAVTVFDWFERKLLHAWKEVSISQVRLCAFPPATARRNADSDDGLACACVSKRLARAIPRPPHPTPLAPWTSVQEELMDQLAKSCSGEKSPRPAYITAEQRSFLDSQVSLLVNAGLLSRQVHHSWPALLELYTRSEL